MAKQKIPYGLLPDWAIEQYVKINPCMIGEHRPGVISYGLSSYGYDVRCSYQFKLFTNVYGSIVDPKNFTSEALVDVDLTPIKHDWIPIDMDETRGKFECTKCKASCWEKDRFVNPCLPTPKYVLIPPNSYALTETLEYFEIPRDTTAICLGKSTYARAGIIVNMTPLEAEWKGHITIEISNATPLPAVIYPGEGIAQILFLRSSASCRVSYADKKGKYQNQKGITPSIVR